MKKGLVVATILVLLTALGIGVAVYARRKPVNDRDKYLSVDSKELKGVARTAHDSPNPTKAQLARKAKSMEAVKKLGLPYLDHLPVVEDESSVKPRGKEEIAKRCLAITICSIKGETRDQSFVKEFTEQFGATDYFSPKEKKFLADPAPSKQATIDFTWQYECAYVLLWALGYVQEIKPPNQACNVATDFKVLKGNNFAKLVEEAKPRPLSEILDMADLYYRLHWAAVELRLKRKSSDKVHEGIVSERHRALNWLIRYMNQEWDDVATDT